MQTPTPCATSAQDLAVIGQECFQQLEALFISIKQNTDPDSVEHRLAGLGGYLALEWESLFEQERNTQTGGPGHANG